MSNRMSAVLQAVNRRKRSVASVVSVAAIGVLALGTLGTGVAAAHGMVGSGEITNQSINSWDIGHNQVGTSELRGPAHDSGPAVDSYHVKDQSLGHWDIKDGTIGEWDLNKDVTTQLNAGDQTGTDVFTNLNENDGVNNLTAGENTTVGTLEDVSAGSLVVGHVTIGGGDSASHNVVCNLVSNETDLGQANEKVGSDGQQNGSMTLVGVTGSDGTVNLNCKSFGSDSSATDITLAKIGN